MTGNGTNDNNIDSIRDSVKEYVNLNVELYKLKSVENLSLLSNKAIVLLIYTMIGAVILQLLGFAAAFFIGDLLGNTALGFASVSILFAIALAIIYAKRDTLFIGKMIRMYMRMFFNSGKQQ